MKRASDDTYSLQSSQDCPHGAAVLNKTNGTDPCFLICFTKPINLAYDKMEPCEVKVVGLKDYICERYVHVYNHDHTYTHTHTHIIHTLTATVSVFSVFSLYAWVQLSMCVCVCVLKNVSYNS